jgi:restriction system protein
MGRRSRGNDALIALAIVVGAPIYAVAWLYKHDPWVIVLAIAAAVVGIAAYVHHKREQLRLFDPSAVDIWTLSPTQYEQYCATILNKFGWRTKLTKASGDHGVDIVAELASVKVAIQIKQYRKRVGNGAVQQVVAGKAVYHCTAAVCVAPNGFTQGAEQLAMANGVLLMRHRDLPGLSRRLGVRHAAVEAPDPRDG